jgi:hypothetical protein
MLGYGCTRIEMGVQSIYEDVARDTNRWDLASRMQARQWDLEAVGFLNWSATRLVSA